jgi:hypothetical protein
LKEKDLEILKLEQRVTSLQSELKFKGSMMVQISNDLQTTNQDWNRESMDYKTKIRELNFV